MATIILGVTISLDGFAEDEKGSVGALYPDLDTLRSSGLLQESIDNTGAVIMSWKEFKMAKDPDGFADTYEYQVPIFVFTEEVPAKHPKENSRLTITFVTDGLESAVRQAKAAARDKDVTIIGSAATTQQFLKAGLADILHVDILPVFLKAGFRPFEDIGAVKLEKIKVIEAGERTHLRYRIVK
jgi:dihydrofolate reductase